MHTCTWKGIPVGDMIFNHSLQTVCQFFKEVLDAVVALSERIVRSTTNYNDDVESYRLNPNKHPIFQDCIRAIDGTHVRAMLPCHECVNFIGWVGVPTQNVLAACDINLCFTFVLVGYTEYA